MVGKYSLAGLYLVFFFFFNLETRSCLVYQAEFKPVNPTASLGLQSEVNTTPGAVVFL